MAGSVAGWIFIRASLWPAIEMRLEIRAAAERTLLRIFRTPKMVMTNDSTENVNETVVSTTAYLHGTTRA